MAKELLPKLLLDHFHLGGVQSQGIEPGAKKRVRGRLSGLDNIGVFDRMRARLRTGRLPGTGLTGTGPGWALFARKTCSKFPGELA